MIEQLGELETKQRDKEIDYRKRGDDVTIVRKKEEES